MVNVLFIFRKQSTGYSIEELFKNIINNLPSEIIHKKINLNSGFKIILSIYSVRKLKFDIIHLTGGQNYFGLFFPFKKIILTSHDLNYFESNLHGLKKIIFWLFWIFLPAIFYNKIVTPSDHSKNQFLKYTFGLFSKKIIIIPNCVNQNFSYTPIISELNEPVILHVGIDENKNLRRVILALRGLNAHLHVIGHIKKNMINLAKNNSIKLSFSAGLTKEEVFNHYIKAFIVSFPSLAEGFGMPILEAQAVGRPVLTSNIEPMKTIAGEGSCLVDPTSIEEIRAGFISLLSNKNYYKSVVINGNSNVKKYSVNLTVAKYRDLYLLVLNE